MTNRGANVGRLTYDIDNKVVSISRGQSENDDEADSPVQGQAGQRGVEWAVGTPEFAEGENTLASELLIDTSL